MPRAKTTPSSGYPERGYIDYRLTEEDRMAVREWCTEAADLWEMVAQLLDSQYVFKVAFDKSNDCYACYISGHWLLNKPDANWTLTGRGSTWDRAVRQALWIHFVAIGTNWEGWRKHKGVTKNWD